MSKSSSLEHFQKYGWKVNEANLGTLPSGAPREAKMLAEWLTLEGRRSSLQEWLNCVKPNGRIHGKFWNIGAWTQRMSHSSPNQANTVACWPEGVKPESPVEEVKARYDSDMRALFKVPDGDFWLVGCDADAIQLRILAHLMESKEYVEAILEGSKDDGTDIHSVNMRALGGACRDRDTSKTFIYAWLLGAGTPKVASILNCTTAIAKVSEQNFLESLPELDTLKKVQVKKDAARGYFIGLDGRKVVCDSEHLMLAGYLQNAEAIIMKMATLVWFKRATDEGIDFKFVNFVHDEWQVEVNGSKEDAERMGEIMAESLKTVGENLKLFCPLAGSYVVGKNWKETH